MQMKQMVVGAVSLCVAVPVAYAVGLRAGLRHGSAKHREPGGWRDGRRQCVATSRMCPPRFSANPATMTQFSGTQFPTIGGAWIEGYPTISNDGSLNGGTPFSVTSRTQGFAAPPSGRRKASRLVAGLLRSVWV